MKYTKSNYGNKVWLPLNIIREATENNWLTSLSYFIWLKKAYRNGTVYDYSTRKVGTILKSSPTTASYHIKVLLSKGLLRLHNGNLTCVGGSKMKSYGMLVAVKVSKNKSEQINHIRYAILKRNWHCQIKEYGKKSEIIRMQKSAFTPYNDLKRINRLIKRYGANPEKTITDKLVMSNAKFGVLCNRSNSTGRRIKRHLQKIGAIKAKKNIKQVFNKQMNRRMFFAAELPSKYFLNKDGFICLQLPDQIVPLH